MELTQKVLAHSKVLAMPTRLELLLSTRLLPTRGDLLSDNEELG